MKDGRQQRYCKKCHAEYMRQTRPKYSELTEEQKKKSNARSYANAYQRRGKIRRSACSKCQASLAQKHHPDYSNPLFVVWLCRSCHMQEHLMEPLPTP